MIGFSLKQLGTYENYSQEGKNTGLQMKMDTYTYGLPEITLKYRPCIEEHVGRR